MVRAPLTGNTILMALLIIGLISLALLVYLLIALLWPEKF
jgi:K+-transporting ATPase KdpF subunit